MGPSASWTIRERTTTFACSRDGGCFEELHAGPET